MFPVHSMQGCGVVEFESPQEAQAAIQQLTESHVSAQRNAFSQQCCDGRLPSESAHNKLCRARRPPCPKAQDSKQTERDCFSCAA